MKTIHCLHRNKYKGVAIFWVAVTVIMLVGIMALMLEGGRVYLTSHHLQNTADASALAGARFVSVLGDPNYPNARDVAVEYALLNGTLGGQIELATNDDNSQERDIVIGRWIPQADPPYFISTLDTPNAMKVVARLDDDLNPSLPMKLGAIFGGQPKNLSRWAIAMVIETAGAGLIALAPDGVGIEINGTPTINVEGGSIYVHSDDESEAMKFIGTPNIMAENINVAGDVYHTGGFDTEDDILYHSETAALNEGYPQKSQPDPYATLPEPSYAGLTDLSPTDPDTGEPVLLKITGGNQTLPAGYYSRGVEITGGTVTMSGMYHFGGDLSKNKANGGFVVKGNGNIDGSAGILIHVVENGELYIGGGGSVQIKPYGIDPYSAFSIFQTRDMNINGTDDADEGLEGNESTIIGTGDIEVDGVLYFPRSLLHVQGTAEDDVPWIGDQLIAWRVEIGGNGEVRINYDGERLPSNMSYLVE